MSSSLNQEKSMQISGTEYKQKHIWWRIVMWENKRFTEGYVIMNFQM